MWLHDWHPHRTDMICESKPLANKERALRKQNYGRTCAGVTVVPSEQVGRAPMVPS